MYFYVKLCTYRKHFKDLQPVGSPAFLGFVDREREVNVSGILGEEQHQEDSPADRNDLPQFGGSTCFIIFYTIHSVYPVRELICSISSHLYPTRTPEA